MSGPRGARPGLPVAGASEGAPVIVPRLPLAIREADVLHFLGYPAGRRPPVRIEPLLGEALREARKLAAARGAFRPLPVSAAEKIGLEAESAAGLVLGLVTVGPGIERRVTELLGRGEAARAVLLDAAGSAAVEEAAHRLSARVVGGRIRPKADAACRISPGYGRWPLSSQKALFAFLPHDEVGVSLNPSLMMVPRKSISFALWIGARRAPRSGLSGCETCGLVRCRYRRPAGGRRGRTSREVTH